jgi:hypothetical protein
VPEPAEQTPEQDQAVAGAGGGPAAEPWRGAPERLVRTCVATLQDSRAFGPLLAAEAPRRHFYAAGRQVFAEVIAEMAAWEQRLGRPPPEEEVDENDPREVLASALVYLRNNQGRMDYVSYRQQGLPVTGSLVESLVGEFNARVKAKNKHWDRPQEGEAILQLRAAVLSEDGRLGRFFATRPGSPYRRRPSAN